MTALVVIGRVLFALIFVLSGINHLVKLGSYSEYAASNGVPAASVAVVVTGVVILAGGLMVLLGWKARLGGLLLTIFLIPTALFMHRFWGLEDAMMAQNQMAHFLKNMSMAGAGLLIFYFGSGPGSLEKSEAGT